MRMKRFFVTALCLMMVCSAALADTLILPENLTTIEDGAFCDDTGLDTVVAPAGLTRIEHQAFAGSSLQKITYPTTASVAGDAFDDVIWQITKDGKMMTLTRGIAAPAAGDMILFGRYEQDNNLDNGTEPIEWLVLDVSEDGKQALLISKYGLDVKQYNTSYEKKTWETCSLRTWLNTDTTEEKSFLSTAFTEDEQKKILTTAVDNSSSQGFDWTTEGASTNPSGGNDTQDRIFLLSYAEANTYFGVTRKNTDNMKS